MLMEFNLKQFQLNELNNHIGHIGYLDSVYFEKLRIQIGINQAMNQNIFTDFGRKFDLWDFEFKVFSQWGEDGIINHILTTLGIAKPNCLEIGIENFTECNTRFLAEYRNANLYLVDSSEGARHVIEKTDLKWKSSIEFEQEFVTTENVSEIFGKAMKSFGTIDLLSLDVDGIDYWLLLELPDLDCSLVVLEYNSIFGADLNVSVPYKDDFHRTREHYSNQFYGASLTSCIDLMSTRNYSFIGTNRANTNAFFVKNIFKQHFSHIVTREIKEYTKANVRESRDNRGNLTYFTQSQGLDYMLELEVFDFNSKSLRTLRDLLSAENE